MDVTFTKVDAKRYSVSLTREHGPPLVPRFGPGNDDLLPHDLAHYVVEEHFGLALGVWGQLASGASGIFYPAPEDNTQRTKQRSQRIAAVGRADMARSEQLVAVVVHAWERSIGRVKHQVRWFDVGLGAEELRLAVVLMNEASERWRALPNGGSLTLTWPRGLSVDTSKTRRGRRSPKRSRTLARR